MVEIGQVWLWQLRRPRSPPGIILLKGGLPSEKISTKELKEKSRIGSPTIASPVRMTQ